MKGIIIAVALGLTGAVTLACNGGEGGPAATPSATTTASVTPAATGTAGGGQIAFFGPDGADIWLINADGSGSRRLTQGQCEEAAGPFWSRRGDKIACVSGGTTEAPQAKIAVVDLKGQALVQVKHKAWLRGFAWSADDRHFVYGIAEGEALETARLSLVISDSESEATVRLDDAQDARWSPDGAQLAYLNAASDELTIYDLASGQTRAVGQGLRPLAWALAGKALLVAANFQQRQEFGADYEANLLDLAGGEMYVTSGGTIIRANLDGTGGVSLGNLKGTLNDRVGIALALVTPPAVGGYVVPVSRVELVVPWLGLGALIVAAVTLLRRRSA